MLPCITNFQQFHKIPTFVLVYPTRRKASNTNFPSFSLIPPPPPPRFEYIEQKHPLLGNSGNSLNPVTRYFNLFLFAQSELLYSTQPPPAGEIEHEFRTVSPSATSGDLNTPIEPVALFRTFVQDGKRNWRAAAANVIRRIFSNEICASIRHPGFPPLALFIVFQEIFQSSSEITHIERYEDQA